MTLLPAINLLQPWPTFVIARAKRAETRSFATRRRGLVALVASKGIAPELRLGRRGRCVVGEFEVAKDQNGLLLRKPGDDSWWPYRLPLGAVVAVADLYDCVPIVDVHEMATGGFACANVFGDVYGLTSDSVEFHFKGEAAYGDFTDGRWAWLLRDVVRLPRPVPVTGQRGWWQLPADVDASVRAQLPAAA